MRTLAAVVAVLAAPVLAQSDAAVSAELDAIAEADQADREAFSAGDLDWPTVAAGDSARQARVEALAGALRLRTGADHYHAALVLQHGGRPYDFYRAYLWSRRAVEELGYEDARWLVPRAYDRWQQSIGRPQVYGTQWIGTPADEHDGAHEDAHDEASMVWSLGNADLDAITDEERARWGVRSAAATRAFVACLNETGDRLACAQQAQIVDE